MELGPTARRRWLGGLVLFAAVAMLICGQTVLKSKLAGAVYLVYWLVCFALTGLAILVAFLDVRALQRSLRKEHRDLLEGTLKRIETDAKAQRPKPNSRKAK